MSKFVDLTYDEQEISDQLAGFFRQMSTTEPLRTQNLMHNYYGTNELDGLTQLILRVVHDEIERRLQ